MVRSILYADWKGFMRLFFLRWLVNCTATVLSQILETNLRLEMGGLFSFVSTSCFRFSVGRTMASFHSFGTVPVDNEKLIMYLVTVGTSSSVHCLSRWVGMGSNAHVLDGANAISSETVSIETLSNDESSQSYTLDRTRFCWRCWRELSDTTLQLTTNFLNLLWKILGKLICEYFGWVMWR